MWVPSLPTPFPGFSDLESGQGGQRGRVKETGGGEMVGKCGIGMRDLLIGENQE